MLKRIASSQCGRFFAVGLVNTAFGYGVFSFLIVLAVDYRLALLASTVLGVLFNFKTTGRYVFSNSSNKRLLRFVAMYVFTFFLNVELLGLLLRYGAGEMVGQALVLPLVVTVTFGISKFWVFKKD